MSSTPPASLADVVAQLYGLAPGVFIKERNALAAQAKSGGDRAFSDQIKQLPKPSIGVWLLNQIARHRPEELARVLGLADALRAAQDDGDGDELRRLSRVRGEVMRETVTAARALGDELGQVVSPSIAGEVEQAVRAALADEDAARALISGQLVRALESTGFGGVDLDGVLAAPELEPTGVLEAPIQPSTEGLGVPGSGVSGSGVPRSGASRSGGPSSGSDQLPEPAGSAARGGQQETPRGVVSLAERRAARQAGSGSQAEREAEREAELAAERAAAAEAERLRKVQQRKADQVAQAAAEAARAADQALAEARHEADETADQLEELATRLSQQREQIRELELAARQARREARDADRARRHIGIATPP